MTINQVLWPGWETVRLIGRGSFGAVYEIQRSIRGRTEHAALKVISIPRDSSEINALKADRYDDESITKYFADSREKIEDEYAMMADLKGHSNVVYCDDIRTVQHDDGFGWDIYIKMELLTPLKSCLSDGATDAQVIQLGMDICDALKLCEELNIVHRDIKPENIFVSRSGSFKLGDFGIAKTMEGTTGGTKTGTYDYMAPEVYSNRPYHTQADIYSLGLVMYWLLNNRTTPFLPQSGKRPTPSEKSLARERRFSGEPFPAPLHGSEALKKIVLKACAFDPKDRYQSAAAMLEDLHSLAGGAVPVFTAAVADGHTDPHEDKKTTGTVFAGTRNVGSTALADTDATVGPVFAVKTPPLADEDLTEGTVGPTFKPQPAPEKENTATTSPAKPIRIRDTLVHYILLLALEFVTIIYARRIFGLSVVFEVAASALAASAIAVHLVMYSKRNKWPVVVIFAAIALFLIIQASQGILGLQNSLLCTIHIFTASVLAFRKVTTGQDKKRHHLVAKLSKPHKWSNTLLIGIVLSHGIGTFLKYYEGHIRRLITGNVIVSAKNYLNSREIVKKINAFLVPVIGAYEDSLGLIWDKSGYRINPKGSAATFWNACALILPTVAMLCSLVALFVLLIVQLLTKHGLEQDLNHGAQKARNWTMALTAVYFIAFILYWYFHL